MTKMPINHQGGQFINGDPAFQNMEGFHRIVFKYILRPVLINRRHFPTAKYIHDNVNVLLNRNSYYAQVCVDPSMVEHWESSAG